MLARQNPFSAQRLDALAWRPDAGAGDLDSLLARLDRCGGRGALVAPDGHGKTTLLAALAGRLEARGLAVRRLTASRDRPLPRRDLARFLRPAGPGDALLLDGAGHLGAWRWRRVRRAARRAAVLLVTLHRPGRLPTVADCTTSPQLLAGLVDELLARAEPNLPLPDLPCAAALHARHAGNLRSALHDLYDRCAGRTPAPVGEAEG